MLLIRVYYFGDLRAWSCIFFCCSCRLLDLPYGDVINNAVNKLMPVSVVVAPGRCFMAVLAQRTVVLCATGVNYGVNSAVQGEPKN